MPVVVTCSVTVDLMKTFDLLKIFDGYKSCMVRGNEQSAFFDGKEH